jgi:hypothetical protein
MKNGKLKALYSPGFKDIVNNLKKLPNIGAKQTSSQLKLNFEPKNSNFYQAM